MPEADVVGKGRLHPGKLFLVDLERERVVPDAELKRELAARQPYGEWLAERVVKIEDLPGQGPRVPRVEPLRARQLAFGWSQEDLRVLLAPMARDGVEPTGSMGNDTALAVLSDNRPPLFSYFKQLFAQVTNPAIDPIREAIVMSLQACVGPEINLLGETPDHCHQLVMPQPILRNAELEKLRQVDHDVFEARTIDITWPVRDGVAGHGAAARARSAPRPPSGRGRDDDPDPLRPQPRPRARADPVAARDRRRPPPPRPRARRGCAAASSSRPARRARSTTSPA